MDNDFFEGVDDSVDFDSFIDIEYLCKNHPFELESFLDENIRYLGEPSNEKTPLDNRRPSTTKAPFRPETPLTPETPFSPQTPFTPETPFRPQTPFTLTSPIDSIRWNLNCQTQFRPVDFTTIPSTAQRAGIETTDRENIDNKTSETQVDENIRHLMGELSYMNEIRDCHDRGVTLESQMSVDCETDDGDGAHVMLSRKRKAPDKESCSPLKKLKPFRDVQIEPIVHHRNRNLDINGNFFDDTEQMPPQGADTSSFCRFNDVINAQKLQEQWSSYDVHSPQSNVSVLRNLLSPPEQAFDTPFPCPRVTVEQNLSPLEQVFPSQHLPNILMKNEPVEQVFPSQHLPNILMKNEPSPSILMDTKPFLASDCLPESSCFPITTTGEVISETPVDKVENASNAKKALKEKILLTRKIKGLGDLDLDPPPKPKPVMTEAEVTKSEHTKKLNKESAVRYRKNKAQGKKALEEEVSKLEQSNIELRTRVMQLEQEFTDIIAFIRNMGHTEDEIRAVLAMVQS